MQQLLVAAGDLLESYARPTIQPEPVAPTDEELRAFYDSEDNDEYEWPWWHRIFRVLLTRYARPAIEPVPVSERLPGPEDCDSEGRCWTYDGKHLPDWMVGNWILRHALYGGNWSWRNVTHWLPHWALPVPAPTNTTREEN
jgi:hypothetical protein